MKRYVLTGLIVFLAAAIQQSRPAVAADQAPSDIIRHSDVDMVSWYPAGQHTVDPNDFRKWDATLVTWGLDSIFAQTKNVPEPLTDLVKAAHDGGVRAYLANLDMCSAQPWNLAKDAKLREAIARTTSGATATKRGNTPMWVPKKSSCRCTGSCGATSVCSTATTRLNRSAWSTGPEATRLGGDGRIRSARPVRTWSMPTIRSVSSSLAELAGVADSPSRISSRFERVVIPEGVAVGGKQAAVLESWKREGRAVPWTDPASALRGIEPLVRVAEGKHVWVFPRKNRKDPATPVACHLFNPSYDGDRDSMIEQTNVVISLRSDLSNRRVRKAVFSTPYEEPQELPVDSAGGRIQVTIPKLILWGILSSVDDPETPNAAVG